MHMWHFMFAAYSTCAMLPRQLAWTGHQHCLAPVSALGMSPALHVPRSLHKTISDRAYPVAAAKVWNKCRWRSRHCRHCAHSSVHWRQNCSADLMVMHITGHSNTDCYVTHAAALQFLLKLVLRWNSWMMMMMMKVASVVHRVKKSIAEKVLTGK